MENLSKKEIEVISDLEFQKKYFFRKEDIKKHFDNQTQITKTIYHLRRKERIVKLNKNKYYLIPIKARTGKWTEHPYIVADEIFDSEDYFIGGWAAANYWKLTDQIPMRTDIWTTKRQGKIKILGIKFQFHRTTKKRVEESVVEKIVRHPFRIQSIEKTKKMDEIKKITKDRLTEVASIRGFGEVVMTKDYYVTLILYLLRNVKGIYFKGGTALQKIYLDYSRLSEDVDYTVTGNVKELKEEISKRIMDSGLFEKVTVDKDVDGFTRLVFHYTNFENKADTVFVDLNQRAKLFEKPETNNIPHFYDEEIPEISIKTLAKKEMFAEKLAATIGRNKPRDHFDVYMLIKNGFKLDYKLAEKKCKQSGCEFDIVKMFNKAKKLHNRWKEDMLPLLADEVEFKEVIKTLAKFFDLKSHK